MTPLETFTLAAYFFVLVILAVYGWHRYYLVYLYMKNKDHQPVPDASFESLPRVTVQLPIYNEMYVADRLIDAVCQLDYPRELLEIQVLDDSTDETTTIAERAVRRHALAGREDYLPASHRPPRVQGRRARGGTQGGAAANTSPFSTPISFRHADFLRRTIHFFTNREDRDGAGAVGPYQRELLAADEDSGNPSRRPFRPRARWPESVGAFLQFQRHRRNLASHAIADAGGWQHDTLTEDLDLSYRAQLRGWKFVFLHDLVSPAEVPVEMNAFKSQQHRWAKGSIQTCRKVLPRILRSDLPLGVKAEAFFHLTANFNYLLMCVLSVLMAPSMVIRYNMGWYEMLLIDVPLFFAATASVANFYMVCQRELHKDWSTRLKYLPFLMSIGIGLTDQQHQGRARGAVQERNRVCANAEIPHRGAGRRMDRQEISPDRRGSADG